MNKFEKSSCDYGRTTANDIVRSCRPLNTTDKVGGHLYSEFYGFCAGGRGCNLGSHGYTSLVGLAKGPNLQKFECSPSWGSSVSSDVMGGIIAQL